MLSTNNKLHFVTLVLIIYATACVKPSVRTSEAKEGKSVSWKKSGNVFDFYQICPLDMYKRSNYNSDVDYWAKIIEGSTKIADTLPGSESGVVVDSPGSTRKIFQKEFPSCGGSLSGVTIRFSAETIPTVARAYEVFIKVDDTGETIGLAFNQDGEEILEVPSIIAYDKDGNKDSARGARYGLSGIFNDKIVRTRKGCFACHPDVSIDYSIPGAEKFWSNATPVEFLQSEKLHGNNHTQNGHRQAVTEVTANNNSSYPSHSPVHENRGIFCKFTNEFEISGGFPRRNREFITQGINLFETINLCVNIGNCEVPQQNKPHLAVNKCHFNGCFYKDTGDMIEVNQNLIPALCKS